jgi:peptidoglycan/xylan/chitin deacetylase (PgdA/CDA1 family)
MARRPPLILLYHGLSDVPRRDDPEALFVAPRQLERHVARLRRWGYELVTFGEIATRVAERRAEGTAALTFDDGFADNAVLLQLGVPATVFVVSGWIGGKHPAMPGHRMLTEDGVRELAAGGIEIGGHTHMHADLVALDEALARADLERGKHELEALLQRPVDVAAYPYGHANDATRRACRDAGFRAACRISGHGSWDDPLDLPRQDMLNGSGVLTLRLKRDDRYESVMRLLPARAVRHFLPVLR